MNPKISVIVPVYNGAGYLRALADTLLAQNFGEWEALLIDDGSSDSSREILRNLEAEDSRFRVFFKQHERYVSRALRFAFQRMQGDWWFYMSQDDLLSPDCFTRMLSAAEKHNAQSVVPLLSTWNKEGATPCPMPVTPAASNPVISGREAFTLSINWQVHGFALFHHSLFEKAQRYIAPANGAPDLVCTDEFYSRILLGLSEKVAFSEGIFLYHQGNPDAITKRWNMDRTGYIDITRQLATFAREQGYYAAATSLIGDLAANESIGCLKAYLGQLKAEQAPLLQRIFGDTRLKEIFAAIRRNQSLWNEGPLKKRMRAKLILTSPLGTRAALLLARFII